MIDSRSPHAPTQNPDGHEIYCRMCGDGGTIITCDERDAETRKPCPYSFCLDCVERNFGADEVCAV